MRRGNSTQCCVAYARMPTGEQSAPPGTFITFERSTERSQKVANVVASVLCYLQKPFFERRNLWALTKEAQACFRSRTRAFLNFQSTLPWQASISILKI